jgi:hypothetical protein
MFNETPMTSKICTRFGPAFLLGSLCLSLLVSPSRAAESFDLNNRPVLHASFLDACRFCNWLHNGQGDGDIESGAYTPNGYTGTDTQGVGPEALGCALIQKWCRRPLGPDPYRARGGG